MAKDAGKDPTKYKAAQRLEYVRYNADGGQQTIVVPLGATLPADFPVTAHTGTPGRDDYEEFDSLADLLKYGSIEKA